jgi:hypothetical protein
MRVGVRQAKTSKKGGINSFSHILFSFGWSKAQVEACVSRNAEGLFQAETACSGPLVNALGMGMNNMENLLSILSTLIVEQDDDAAFRLQEQQTNLSNNKCTKPDLGKWIDNCDFPFLIEGLLKPIARIASTVI